MWDKIGSRGKVFDRRGSPQMIGGGLGIAGIAIILLLNILGGGDLTDVLTTLEQSQLAPTDSYDTSDFEGLDSYEVFASTVLGSANDMWSDVFARNSLSYTEPSLVLFRGGTESGCGGAMSYVGPHYCPADNNIYLDETFFEELEIKLGAEGGDVAEAYVIAHEVGHHVQNELGILDGSQSNADSIKVELQADCFAGLWAYSIRDLGVFEPGEINEAMDAAAAVGDDRIQQKTTGRVDQESWTHGSSAQRLAAFDRGYETGQVTQCEIN